MEESLENYSRRGNLRDFCSCFLELCSRNHTSSHNWKSGTIPLNNGLEPTSTRALREITEGNTLRLDCGNKHTYSKAVQRFSLEASLSSLG